MRKNFQQTISQFSSEPPAAGIFSGRHLIFGLILLLIAGLAGSATYFWRGSIKTIAAVGVIAQVNGATEIVVSRYNKEDLTLKMPTDVRVIKDKASAHVSGLVAGDTVRIEYISGPIGAPRATVIRATSPFISGRIVGIDLKEQTISILAKTIHKFKVRNQTVVLRNGSLAHLYDLKLGSHAKAEYRNVPEPQLELLLITD